MAIKTDWFQNASDASPETVDPFATAAAAAPPVQGKAVLDLPIQAINLDMPLADLEQRASILIGREARLADSGVSCEIKDKPDMSCLACPFSKADDESHRKCGLCRLGREQEIVGTYMIARRAIGGG